MKMSQVPAVIQTVFGVAGMLVGFLLLSLAFGSALSSEYPEYRMRSFLLCTVGGVLMLTGASVAGR